MPTLSLVRLLRLASGLWLLLAAGALRAQRGPTYWNANVDSLARVLASQRTDTARLRTLEHLADLRFAMPEMEELATLTARLHRPEQRAYRLWLAGDADSAWLGQDPAAKAAARDSLQAAVAAFGALGRPATTLLVQLATLYGQLHQPAARRAYFARQLARYQSPGAGEERAACYHGLAGAYLAQGDYDQAISYYLRAAEEYRRFSQRWYYNELGVVGDLYAEWGNEAEAERYLRQSLRAHTRSLPYNYRSLAKLYLRQRRYAAARQAVAQALQVGQQLPKEARIPDQAHDLCLQSAILLAQHHVAAAGQMLSQVQHLADSLHLPLTSSQGDFELDATWAQYYEVRGATAQAEARWRRAYRQAQLNHSVPLRLAYLRQLACFYRARGQARPAASYALAAASLADTLAQAQNRFHVAHFAREQAAQAQTNRIARLRRAQEQAATQAQRQRLVVWGLLAGAGLLGGLVWRQRRTNALLAAQKQQIEQQAQRLGELDEAKNQFFANISHELRTPLTLVLGPLEGLLTAPPKPLPPATHAPVALAHRHAQRLLGLVNRILDLTKLQAGRLEVHPTPTPLAPFLRRVVAQFDSLATQRHLTLVGPPGLPENLWLLLDADKVEQVLTNLLSNALRHTPAGGTVWVTTTLSAPADGYAVTVHDTGPGIAAAEQARVFERFYQSPQHPAQGGTGLGLALSRQLAQLLGGSLTLRSEVGQGAAFTLSFPAEVVPRGAAEIVEEVTEPAGPARPAALPPSAERPRVLVVEDEPELRAYLRTLLAPTCEVLLARDGQEALDVLGREAPVDLLTTDAMMPRLSGTELLARLRADPAQASVPVLMLTARADEAHRLAALTVGVDDYLTKPFRPAELLARVQALLTRQQVRRQFAALPPEPVAEAAEGPVPALPPAADFLPPTAGPDPAAQLAAWQAQVAPYLADPDFGPEELAAQLLLSRRTLYRRLGELAGLTPAAWLRELRLAHARHLLEAGQVGSVTEVAEAAGFANAKYFSSLYAERFGRRPSDYLG